MGADSLQNIQSIVTALAAVVGVRIAWLGLSAWKQQTRWQQGRGLAVNTMQSFFEFKRVVLAFPKVAYFQYDKDGAEEQRVLAHTAAAEQAAAYCEKLENAFTKFESYIAEAIIVWDDDFEEIQNRVSDIEHIVRGAVLSGVSAINPKISTSQRESATSVHQAWKSDYFGVNEEKRSVGMMLAEAQQMIEKTLKRKKLS